VCCELFSVEQSRRKAIAGEFAPDPVSWSWLCASWTAMFSYSSGEDVMSSGRPIAVSKLAATLPANVSPICVNTGNPAHSASLAVAPAL
jgi:hypothetical protein